MVSSDLDKALFDTEMAYKENSYAEYKYGIDGGLDVAAEDGKVALVQNLMADRLDIRNAALECAVIDKTGVIYRGRLKSSIADLEYDMSEREVQIVRHLLDGAADGKVGYRVLKQIIEPVRNENWCEWDTSAR